MMPMLGYLLLWEIWWVMTTGEEGDDIGDAESENDNERGDEER